MDKEYFISIFEITEKYKEELEKGIIPKEIIPKVSQFLLDREESELVSIKILLKRLYRELTKYIYFSQYQERSDYDNIMELARYLNICFEQDKCIKRYFSSDVVQELYHNTIKDLKKENDKVPDKIPDEYYSEESIINMEIISLLVDNLKEEYKNVDLWE